MRSDQEKGAWLEIADRDSVWIEGTCSIGRSSKNTILQDSPDVSRRHALINLQNVGEFWLIDLGSINGTFLNKRRIHQPMRLNDRDQILIGAHVFVFRQSIEITREYQTAFAERTIRQIANVPCWLLLADVENYTPLSRSLGTDELAVLLGSWIASCKRVIEEHGGVVDKYLGDGFLAYWREEENTTAHVVAVIRQLKEAQARNEPRFRLALHYGMVAIGGIPSMGEESLMGKDVNFVFRMEKLAASLGIMLLISAAAKAKLDSLLASVPAGCHELKGFEGRHAVFSC